MVAPALSLDPTPKSVEELIARLPARHRADLAWFPPELRARLVEPLRSAGETGWQAVLDEATLDAARAFFRLARAVAPILRDAELAPALRAHDAAADAARHESIAARLEPLDVRAADQLSADLGYRPQ